MKNEAIIREAINRGIFEEFDREAELLRQQRDDITLTLDVRKKANNELASVLKEQERIMLENAAVVERAAAAEFKANNTTENRVKLIEAQNEVEAIRADITGRRSEQLINEIALDQEGADKKKEITEKETELLKASGLKAIEIGIELKALRAEAGLDDPDATVEQIQESFNAKQEVENSLYDLQLEQNQERFDNGLILEEERNAQKELIEQQHTLNIEAIKTDSIETISKREKAAADLKAKNEKLAASGTIDVAQNVLSAVSSVLAEGSAEAKAIALAQATISGFQGVQAAFSSTAAIPVVGPALAPIAAASAGVVAAKNIQKIAQSGTGTKKVIAIGLPSFNAPSISAAPSLTMTLYLVVKIYSLPTQITKETEEV